MFLKPKKKKKWGVDDFREVLLGNRFWFFFHKKKKKVAFPFTLVKAIPSNVL